MSSVNAGAIAPALNELISLRGRVAGDAWRRGMATGGRAGTQRAMALGRGMEFAELRPYQPGDDLRNVDWRHTARRGRPFTKLFHEERERPVLLFADLGPSMQFGTRTVFKSVLAARTAALLAWAAVDVGDRVGGVIWDGVSHRDIRPRGREAGALALLHALTQPPRRAADAHSAHGFGAALDALARALRPGADTILLSDFHTLDAAAERAMLRLRACARLALVQVFDPLEATPPPPGIYRIADTQGVHTLDLTADASRAAYGATFRQRSAHLAALARRLGAAFVPLATSDDPLQALHELVGRR